MSRSLITYSVVIPVYNSTDSLKELTERLTKVFTNSVRDTYEILFIDDASPNPETWNVLEDLAEQHVEVKSIQLRRNFGKAGAILCGFAQAQGQYIFTLDDDLQHLPEDIPKFIEYRDHDVVMGAYTHKQHAFSKRLTSRIKGWFDRKIAGKPPHLQTTPFKLYKAEIIESMLNMTTPYPFISALMYYTTRDIVTVDIDHGLREYGQSAFTFRKRLTYFSNLL